MAKSKIFLTKRCDGALVPTFNGDKEYVDKLNTNDSIQVSFSLVRNPKHHALYWVMITKVAESVGKSKQFIHNQVKYLLGEYEIVGEFGEKTAIRFSSTDYANMDKVEFELYYTKAVEALSEAYGDWVKSIETREQIQNEI